ncbi:TonB-dependent receptor [Asticcacaulis sp. EMRT-3]|uniref:TonB-dependent receptor n=1 Tax=Asticcacaulis sp. EMRT-3 TaxID=3040349 RepID=UPI0024AEB42F|nr:TonB-dependent receptor [Asticcacaulis sp. EMRT-3]MDI7776231.1 TonB-dependent receptor [Asticcacaulis sp. EMRT-3]
MSPTFRHLVLAGASFLALGAGLAQAQTSTPADSGSATAQTDDKSGDDRPTEVIVRARRLDAARDTIQPDVGGSTYTLPQAMVKALPGGDNVGLNQVILQAPGVTQDSYGQLHVRGDHNGLQYRLNGVILPEGLSNFGDVLSPRFAASIQLVTGALPAQYGLRTAGVINMSTQSGIKNGGTMSLYGGSHGLYQPSITYGGSHGNDTYFGSLSYEQSQLGIEAPYNTGTPLHDRTAQIMGFGYYDHLLDDTSRISVMGGVSDQSFQLPNTPGLNSVDDGAGYQVNGVDSFSSNALDSHQKETTDYAIVSYLKTTGDFTGQVSLFARASRLTYYPDWDAELAFNGVSQAADKRDTSVGLQAEGAWTITPRNTLRAGLILSGDRSVSRTTSHVFDLDGSGAQTSDTPVVIVDNGAKSSATTSLYVQDEWIAFTGFTLNYGLRYDKLDSYRSEDQLSPRINFVWTPEGFKGLTLHGGYARYFTPPPYELIAGQTQALFAGTSFDLSGQNDLPYAQRDNYYDLGVQQRFGPHLTLGLDAYHRVARYLLDEGQFGAPIILTPFNYKYGRNTGVELTANYENGPLTAYANYAVSEAKGRQIVSSQFNFSPEDQAYAADHFIYVDHNQTTSASMGVTYRIGKSHVSLDAIYGSGLRTDGGAPDFIPNGARLPAYTQVNASVSHDFARGITVRLDVTNLFDRAYEIRDGGGIGVGAPQWGPRRGVFVGLSKDF